MIKEVRLPEISENVETGDVIKLLVSVGQVIDADAPVVELETDKAVLEVPSPFKGKVTEILVEEGDTIKIDQVILKIDTAATEGDAPAPKKEPAKKKPAGKTATKPEPVAAAPKKTRAAKSSPPPAESAAPAARAETKPSPAPPPARHEEAAPASPSLRRMARELGVDIRKVAGTGPGGRISSDDLKSYAREAVAAAGTAQHESAANAVTESTKWGPVVREPMSKVRKVTAKTMTEAWTTIPQVTQYDKVDITELEDIRKQFSQKVATAGGKLTVTAILVKVLASALKVFPQFNASLDLATQEIIYKRYYHMGVAVDTDRGLLVPVIRSIDKKNITEISSELNQLAEKARDKKLSLDEMEGATFTLSNLGGIGGTNFSPIVYPPQVAILGVARARIEPVYTEEGFEPRLMLPLSVSYDHRIIDGADGARFLRWIVQALEEPILLALEG